MRAGIAAFLVVELLAAVAAGFIFHGCLPGIIAVYAAVGLAAVVFERGRFRAAHGGSAGAVPTAEWNIDPVSGETLRVYVDPRTGGRFERREVPHCDSINS